MCTILSKGVLAMKDRLKRLRKNILKMNQTEFGKKIGIGAQAIAEIEKGRNELTERNFEAICRTFNVNPNWLRNGVGEVFIENKESALKNIVEEFDLEPDEAALIGALLELPKDYRAGVVKYVKRLAVMFEENERAAKEPELT